MHVVKYTSDVERCIGICAIMALKGSLLILALLNKPFYSHKIYIYQIKIELNNFKVNYKYL